MSTISVIVVLSLAGAGGALLAVSAWLQPAPSLQRTMRDLRRNVFVDDPRSAGDDERRQAYGRLLAPITRVLGEHARVLPSVVDLRLVGRSAEQHVRLLCTTGAIGAVAPALVLGIAQQTGLIGLGWYVPLGASLVAAVLLPAVVHVHTAESAQRIRADLRHQVSAFLDVVTMLLAGNSGYEGALEQAAHAGDGRLFTELRRRMRDASTRGASLTVALHDAGVELGLEELEQVAATAAVSAAEGAPVARTLAAKCATLRTALATDQESEARLRTSRLTTPIVGMALIFMALVIYPALSFS